MTIVFCLPGNSFSGNFLDCWTETLAYCFYKEIKVFIQRKYTSNVYYVRNMCLGADVLMGKDQKPFNGKIKYDYIMFIDSDQVWKIDDFEKLLSRRKTIVSGLYLSKDGYNFTAVKEWDKEYFKENGSFKFITYEEIKGEKNLIQVAYNGFGFMLIKKGVFESLEYPWFSPIMHNFGNGIQDFASEDVSFCEKVIKKGMKIWVDPTVIVGHEKSVVIRP